MLKKVVPRDLNIWGEKNNRKLISLSFELTNRCNNNCTHCYINVSENDKESKGKELSLEEIEKIATDAEEMGVMFCLISGGEPLLRRDFSDIYLMLKKKGFLVIIFTNATLVTDNHIELFKQYPPYVIEVSVYGITEQTYEKVSRKKGTYKAMINGLKKLNKAGLNVRLKAMAIRSNYHEMDKISSFCKEYTLDYYRFDPQITLRLDRDQVRNKEILSERLAVQDIIDLENKDEDRMKSLYKTCDKLHAYSDNKDLDEAYVLGCGAGMRSLIIGADGIIRLCSSLGHESFCYDVRKGSLKEAYYDFVPKVRKITSKNPEFLNKCVKCELINLCHWCPANAYMETGKIDEPIQAFCDVTYGRYKNIIQSKMED